VGRKEFEGDGAAEFQILSAKNDTHASGAELFLQQIIADLSARHRVNFTAQDARSCDLRRISPMKLMVHADDVVRTVRNRHIQCAVWIQSLLIFNVRHNYYHLIAKVDYRAKLLMVKEFLTHKEYTRGGWKKWAR
jgi:mRNA-degrading endonuclease HigB of HigAB toxin-antitoxin module